MSIKKVYPKPPKTASWILEKLVDDSTRDTAMGDLEELYIDTAENKGLFAARFLYLFQIVVVFPAFFYSNLYWRAAMIKNYIKVAMRNIRRNKGYAFINISGLAIGIACFLLIGLYVYDELVYDRYHEKADRIYRLTWEVENKNVARFSANSSMVTALKIAEYYPEIEGIGRIERFPNISVMYEDKVFKEEEFFYADQSIFDIFTFRFISGNPEKYLTEPNTIVLTESAARRYFGDEPALGKTLIVEKDMLFEVTGIIEDIPEQSHFHADFLASMETIGEIKSPWSHWGWTYIVIPENYQSTLLQSKLEEISDAKLGIYIEGMKYKLQPLTEIHLHSHYTGEIEVNGDIRYVYIFSLIAVLILLIACINYMNITTARSAHRTLEVGIRKVVGSYRSQLIAQFLGESIIFSMIGVICAVIIIGLTLPVFNVLLQKNFPIHYLLDYRIILACLSIGFLVGILSGSYPGLFLSAFRPLHIMRGLGSSGKGAKRLRKILVVFQFSITISLIVSTVVIHKQLQYIQGRKLGFDKENILILPIRDDFMKKQYESVKNELLRYPAVTRVSAGRGTPFAGGMQSDFKDTRLHIKFIDHDYIPLMGIELAEGRNFSKENSADAEAYILNETAVKLLEWEEPVGMEFRGGFNRREPDLVIGVVKDFHNNSLHRAIEPVVFQIYPDYYSEFYVKFQMSDLEGVLKFLEKKWREFTPYRPFEYSFLDDNYDRLYRSEQRLGDIFNYFALLTVFIACLGLYGLAAFSVEQRKKEIGVRKVLGASVSSVIKLVSVEFIKLVVIANIIAWPLSYYAINKWLQNFEYRIETGLFLFIASALFALFIAFFTVSYQAVQAATANPAEALRSE